MWDALRRAWKSYPVTVAIVAVAGALFLSVRIHEACFPEDAGGSLRTWGAARQLGMFVQKSVGAAHEQIPQFTGAFDLWADSDGWFGQWWRVFFSGLHHAGVLHLVMNCAAMWFLGRLLEPKLGKWAFLAFFVVATTVSLLPEFFLEHSAVGMSGGIFAVFGALMVIRHRDQQVAAVFTEGIVQFGLFWLFACVVLTALDILAIANAAHFCGFAYGWIAGQALFGAWSPRRWVRFGFLAAHLALIPAFYTLSHPVWIGRYHWYLAIHEEDPQRKADHLKKAVAIDPSLRKPWRLLAEQYARQGRWRLAWETILAALKHNRTDEKSAQLSREIWMRFAMLDQQEAAMRTLDKTFGPEAEKFRDRLGIEVGRPGFADFDFLGDGRPRGDDSGRPRFPLDWPVDPPVFDGWGELRKRNLSSPPVDPNHPESAAEGTSS